MKYRQITRVEELRRQIGPNELMLAGGTDVLTRMEAGLIAPDALYDLKQTDLPSGITEASGVVTIGALTTLSDLARHSGLRQRYAALTEAASQAATTQIRNRATLAGNLLQRPRCWYYRDPDIECWLKSDPQARPEVQSCPAKDGRNAHHAIFGDGVCRAVHPSDLAPCLVALGASVTVIGDEGRRQFAVEDLFCTPTDEHRRETVLADGEVIESITLPPVADRHQSIYLKAMDRKAWSFALVSCAISASSTGSGIDSCRIVLGGVASMPWRLRSLEHAVIGSGAKDHGAAIGHALSAAQPLSENQYKTELAAALIDEGLSQIQG